MHLESRGLIETIKENSTASSREKAEALIFIRKHLDDCLLDMYLFIEDPVDILNELKVRFNHNKGVILPGITDVTLPYFIKQKFAALDVTGNNYMYWRSNAEIHLMAQSLDETIEENNTTSSQEKAKAMSFLRKHLDYRFKYEFLDVRDPSVLWKELKERFHHPKEVILTTITGANTYSEANKVFSTTLQRRGCNNGWSRVQGRVCGRGRKQGQSRGSYYNSPRNDMIRKNQVNKGKHVHENPSSEPDGSCWKCGTKRVSGSQIYDTRVLLQKGGKKVKFN